MLDARKIALMVLGSIFLFGVIYASFYSGLQTARFRYESEISLLEQTIENLENESAPLERWEALITLTQAVYVFDKLDEKHIYYVSANETHAFLYMSEPTSTPWKCIAIFQFKNGSYIVQEEQKNA